MTPSEMPRESAPADAARRSFIEQYGKLALATPAAMYALMSPRRAQAQVTSNGVTACIVGLEISPGRSCTVDIPGVGGDNDLFEVLSSGWAAYGGGVASAEYILGLNGFRAERIPGADNWRITEVS